MPKPPPPLRIPVGTHGITTQLFWESDVGKWIEAASYALATGATRRSRRAIDESPSGSPRPSEPDGYFNSFHRARAGQALDQPARLARALLRRPPYRGRGRLRPRDRQGLLST